MKANIIVDLLRKNQFMPKLTPESTKFLINNIVQAQKFYIGPFDLPPAKHEGPCRSYMRLPFPVSYFEFSFDDGMTLGVLAAEEGDETFFWSFVYKKGRLALTVVVMKFDPFGKFLSATGGEPAIYLASSVARVLSVMKCTNVEAVEVEVPSRVNKKRLKLGKLPLFTHKVLCIKLPIGRRSRTAGSLDSFRRGPRVHFRRGHYRTLSDGRAVWVQACAVGATKNGRPPRGVVTKDYILST